MATASRPERTRTTQGSRRDAILAEAARLFATRGVAATTVRDIGDAVGMKSGSLYNYFVAKEEIVDEIVSTYLLELTAGYEEVVAANDDPRRTFEGLVRTSFGVLARHRDACELYQNDVRYIASLPGLAHLPAAGERIQKTWMKVIEAGVDSGAFRADVDPALFYRFARDAVWFTVRWYRPDGPSTIDEIADACLTVLMTGFAPVGR
jgi:TetR/AcrR family transcriptional regulator, cholesterol catabolism regulator